MKRIFLVMAMWFLPIAAAAQSFPDYTSPFVNDFADLLSTQTEAQLTQELTELRAQDGVEMTVVTIKSLATYGAVTSVPVFATDLFNHWGVGNADRNDGVLMLISEQDREVFIALGDAYGPEYDGRMDQVFDQYMRDNFRANRFEQGTIQGVAATIERLDPAFAPSRRSFGDRIGSFVEKFWVFGLFAGFFAFVFGRKKIQARKDRTCPQCTQRSLTTDRRFDPTSTGDGRMRVVERTCSACGFHDLQSTYMTQDEYDRHIRRSNRSGGGGFGGGSSSGGGGGGRW